MGMYKDGVDCYVVPIVCVIMFFLYVLGFMIGELIMVDFKHLLFCVLWKEDGVEAYEAVSIR